MLPKNFERIDNEIKNLIILINKTSFLETTTSCAGHPERNKNSVRVAITVYDEKKWFKFLEKVSSEIEKDEKRNFYKIFFQARFYIENKKLTAKNWVILIKPLNKKNTETIRNSLNSGIKKLENIFNSVLKDKV